MPRFTLDDLVVKNSIRAISDIGRAINTKLILVGGTAVQTYTKKPELRRATNDIDILASRIISISEFRDKLSPVFFHYMGNLKHKVKRTGKTRFGYEISLDCDREDFYIHISRFSKNYIEKHKDWKQREIKNSRIKVIEDLKDFPVYVHRIEDIFANKARRIGRLYKNGLLNNKQEEKWKRLKKADFEYLNNTNLDNDLKELYCARNRLLDIGKENFIENKDRLNRFKATKDFYDVSLLCREIVTGREPIDIEYFKKAMITVPTINYEKPSVEPSVKPEVRPNTSYNINGVSIKKEKVCIV